jgi:hypothetical protein
MQAIRVTRVLAVSVSVVLGAVLGSAVARRALLRGAFRL